MGMINIGIQLYSVREEIEKYGLDTVLGVIRDAGFDSVEFAGFYGLTPAQMKQKLEQFNLIPLAAHIGIDGIDESIPYIDELGIKKVYIPGYPYELLCGEEYQKFVARVNEKKQNLDVRGVEFGYHNHAHEYQNGDDKVYELISDIDGFTSELDIFWAKAGGHEPCELIQKYGNKLSALHLKDMDKQADPSRPTEYHNAIIGEGQCDCKKAYDEAKKLGVTTFILEVEDYPCAYDEYLKKSCANIKAFEE